MIGEDSILERVTVAAEERHLSHNSLIAYRRTWLKIIAWAAAEGLVLETFPAQRVGEFYEETTGGRSASHHLQVKAALALLYHVLGSPNPFAKCLAPKFAPEKTELRYHTSSQMGQLLRELREDKASYFGHLTYHLATALFFTGCRYHEWALLTIDRLVREPEGVIIAARLQVKGGSFRDLPLTTELSDSLEEWFAFLESVKGVRLRRVGESTSRDRRSSFLAETARPLATRPSTHASSSPASARGCQSFPLIPCAIRPRRSFQRARSQPARRPGPSRP